MADNLALKKVLDMLLAAVNDVRQEAILHPQSEPTALPSVQALVVELTREAQRYELLLRASEEASVMFSTAANAVQAGRATLLETIHRNGESRLKS